MGQFPPQPQSIPLGPFRIFSKIQKFAEIFASQGAPQVSMTPAATFAPSFASVIDTGGKFATGVNDTGGNFAAGVNDTLKRTGRQKLIYMLILLPKGVQRWQRWQRWQTFGCKDLREFSKKFGTALTVKSGAWGKLIHEKNKKRKIS
jgi:hypothetical protein